MLCDDCVRLKRMGMAFRHTNLLRAHEYTPADHGQPPPTKVLSPFLCRTCATSWGRTETSWTLHREGAAVPS